MAKRGASKGGVVIAQEILALVEANNAIKGPEVIVALREKFPKISFNEASCQVAYANARRKLGLTRTMVKRPVGARPVGARHARPGRPSVGAPSAAAGGSDFGLLQAAKTLLVHCNGDAQAAMVALKQVASLQMD